MRKIPKSAKKGIIAALAIYIILGVVGMFLYATKAESAEWFPEKPTVFLGIDYVKDNMFCEKRIASGARIADPDEHWVSNAGVRIPIVDFSHFRLQGGWTHHSCALGYDAPTYDGTGLQLEWRF